MKKTLLALAAFALVGTTSAMAASVCPAIGASVVGHECAATINITSDGSGGFAFALTSDPLAGTYDGSEDIIVGITNNSGSPFTGDITLTGYDAAINEGIFGFDGDGICIYVSNSGCSTTGYEGPLVSFNGISADERTGNVHVAGLADGASTYFALEASIDGLSGGGGITVGTPEPATFAMIGGGLSLLALVRRRKR